MLNELKPLDLGGILEKTFRLTFSNLIKNIVLFLIYFGIIICVFIGIAGVVIYLIQTNKIDPDMINFMNFFQTYDYTLLQNSIQSLFGIFIPLIPFLILAYIIFFIVQVFYNGMLNDIFIKSITGETWNFKSSFNFIKTKFWRLAGTGFISGFIILGGFILCCIGIIPAVIIIAFFIPAILFENKKIGESVSRGFKLISYNFWGIIGTFLLLYLIEIVVSLIFNGITGVINIFFISLKTGENANIYLIVNTLVLYIVRAPLSILYQALDTAFFNVIFFNQKVKHENYGIEVLANTLNNEINSMDTNDKT
jgi:hypothetical protein